MCGFWVSVQQYTRATVQHHLLPYCLQCSVLACQTKVFLLTKRISRGFSLSHLRGGWTKSFPVPLCSLALRLLGRFTASLLQTRALLVTRVHPNDPVAFSFQTESFLNTEIVLRDVRGFLITSLAKWRVCFPPSRKENSVTYHYDGVDFKMFLSPKPTLE